MLARRSRCSVSGKRRHVADRGPQGAGGLLIRGGDLGKSMSRYLIDQIERDGRLGVLHHTEVRELRGDGGLEAVVVQDAQTGERRELN